MSLASKIRRKITQATTVEEVEAVDLSGLTGRDHSRALKLATSHKNNLQFQMEKSREIRSGKRSNGVKKIILATLFASALSSLEPERIGAPAEPRDT